MSNKPQLTKGERNRMTDCQEAIDGVLKNYQCDLVPQLVILGGRIVSHTIGIVPLQEENRIIVPKVDASKIDLSKKG